MKHITSNSSWVDSMQIISCISVDIPKAKFNIIVFIKNYIIGYCNSRVLIDLAIIVSCIRAIIQCSTNIINCTYHFVLILQNNVRKIKSALHYVYFIQGIICGHCFIKTIIIPLILVGYEMITANLALRALVAIYHLLSKLLSWNNIPTLLNNGLCQ